ncbi:MAG: DUF432 domain-containing protein [Desulfurococcaceae archaeon]
MFKRLDKNLVEIELYRHNNRDVIGVIGLAENDEITLVPYPLGRESNIKCLMFKLKQPITVLPNSKIAISTYLPFSIAIFSNNALIKIVNVFKIKLALYGTPTMGDLCIYVRESDLINYSELLANLKIILTNNTHEALAVEKLIMPVEGLGIFSNEYGDVVYNVVKAFLISTPRGTVIEISTTTEPSRENNFKGIIKPETVTYIMRHGY